MIARWAAVLLAWAVIPACGRARPAPPPDRAVSKTAAQGKTAAVGKTTSGSTAEPGKPARPSDEDRARLAEAYRAIRCGLQMGGAPSPGLYPDHGFADAAAFGRAFEREADRDADWARGVVAGSLRQPCGAAGGDR